MGFFDFLKPGGDTVKGALEGAGQFAKDMRSAITGDISAEKKAELELKAAEIEAAVLRAQNEVNKSESASPSLFVAGWRPFIGWTGGITLFSHYIVKPWAEWALSIAGKTTVLPSMDLSGMYPIIIGMLGLGLYRTVEKGNGVQNLH
jgi:hypothetical protein